jgi:RNA polymerase sigma-70 factor (ECF subfamily)
MNDSGNLNAALSECEKTVQDYMARGEFTLAVSVLVQHYQDVMVSYCACHLFDQEVAHEVAQEIFLAAFESLPHFRGQSTVKTWLYGIAFKKCLEAGRNRKRREALFQEHQSAIGARVHCDPPSQPEEIFYQETRRRRVWHALHQLRIYERELLVLRYLEDLTYADIASILKVSQRTVERHLPRAEAKFHQAYERWEPYAVLSQRTPVASTAYAGLVTLVQDLRSS